MVVGRSSLARVAVVVALLGGAATAGVGGQATGDQSPSFEVASVKHNKSDSPGMRVFFQPGGRFVAENITLQLLIGLAYGDPRPLADFQIIGGPKWIGSDRFNLVAKAEGELQMSTDGPSPTVTAMLRTLLAERFKLRVRDETREMPIYTLVKARHDGKLGEHLKPSATDCAALMKSDRDRAPTPPSPTERPPCGIRMGFGSLSIGGMTVLQFAGAISRMPGINRVVLDRTGLDGAYDIDLQWTPDQLPPRAAGGAADGPIRVNGVDVDPNGPSIFTAIQEQLGLKLESTKGPVHVIVIDAVDQPTDD